MFASGGSVPEVADKGRGGWGRGQETLAVLHAPGGGQTQASVQRSVGQPLHVMMGKLGRDF